MQYKWLFFDCMETLVDFDPVPGPADYAAWAFDGSGVEEFWDGFNQFHSFYLEASHHLSKSNENYAEWSTLERFRSICNITLRIAPNQIDTVARQLEGNFYQAYRLNCFVRDDVKKALPELSKRYQLGVVSNFKIENGIREILTQFELIDYFEWVITSFEVGWRKPNRIIYNNALKLSCAKPEEVLFIGDDLENDVKTPKSMGMNAILLDRNSKQYDSKEFTKISSFLDLQEVI